MLAHKITKADEDEIARARGAHWAAGRRQAIERDRYRCRYQGCGNTDTLEVHHKRPLRCFSRDDEARANHPSNLVTLCREHHREVERTVAHLPSHFNKLPDNLNAATAAKLRALRDQRVVRIEEFVKKQFYANMIAITAEMTARARAQTPPPHVTPPAAVLVPPATRKSAERAHESWQLPVWVRHASMLWLVYSLAIEAARWMQLAMS